ncbi:hypothetical protein BKI52_03990 [marine bacterium AO1-C]|nr:hypothetical protein BKI52_03990 [marine bacterium AO1-C]
MKMLKALIALCLYIDCFGIVIRKHITSNARQIDRSMIDLSVFKTLQNNLGGLITNTSITFDVPEAPINLNAKITLNNQVELNWQDQSVSENGFEIYRSINNNSNFNKLVTLTQNTESFIDRSVVGGDVYYYKVRAINNDGNSAFSNEVNVNIAFISSITLQAFAYNTNSIRLFWVTNNTNIDGYKIERANNSVDVYSEIASVVGNTIEYIDQNLESNSTYFYRIRAFRGNSFSQYSNRIGANTLVTGISDALSQQIKVLNNPNVTGIFQIKAEELNTQNWQLKLMDQQMKVLPQYLIRQSDIGYRIDLRQQPPGAYFLIFDTYEGKVIKKLIKL